MSDINGDDNTHQHSHRRCITCKHWKHIGNPSFWNDWADCGAIPDTTVEGFGEKAKSAYVDGQGMVNGALTTHSQFGCVLYERKA